MLLGGIVTDLLSWRWILFINVPIGLIAAVAAHRLLQESRNTARAQEFDVRGALAATLGLSLLVLGIVRTDQTGWGDTSTLLLIAAGIALLGVFVLIEGRVARSPLMPLRIYRSRTLSAANVIVLLVGAASFGMWFFMSLYLQQVHGYSPIRAGLAFLPMTLCIVAGSTIASRLVGRVGAKPVLIAGMTSLTVGLFWFTDISVSGTYVGSMLFPSLLTALGHRPGLRPGHDQRGRRRGPRRRRAWPRVWSTPRGCSAAHWGWPSWRRSPRRGPTQTCTTPERPRTPRSSRASSSPSSSPRRSPSSVPWWRRSGCRGCPRGHRPRAAGWRPSSRHRPPRFVTMRRAVARCFVTRDLPGPALDRLRERHEVDVWPERLPPPTTSCAPGRPRPRACCRCSPTASTPR